MFVFQIFSAGFPDLLTTYRWLSRPGSGYSCKPGVPNFVALTSHRYVQRVRLAKSTMTWLLYPQAKISLTVIIMVVNRIWSCCGQAVFSRNFCLGERPSFRGIESRVYGWAQRQRSNYFTRRRILFQWLLKFYCIMSMNTSENISNKVFMPPKHPNRPIVVTWSMLQWLLLVILLRVQ